MKTIKLYYNTDHNHNFIVDWGGQLREGIPLSGKSISVGVMGDTADIPITVDQAEALGLLLEHLVDRFSIDRFKVAAVEECPLYEFIINWRSNNDTF